MKDLIPFLSKFSEMKGSGVTLVIGENFNYIVEAYPVIYTYIQVDGGWLVFDTKEDFDLWGEITR